MFIYHRLTKRKKLSRQPNTLVNHIQCSRGKDIIFVNILLLFYYCSVRAFGFTSLLSISLLIYLPHLLSTPLYRTLLIILSPKLWQLLSFCLLAVLPYRRSSPSCIALLFSIIAFSSVSSSPVSFSIFPCPLVLPLFRILLLHVSGLLLSFYIVRISFLPVLSSIPLLWSRFHI